MKKKKQRFKDMSHVGTIDIFFSILEGQRESYFFLPLKYIYLHIQQKITKIRLQLYQYWFMFFLQGNKTYLWSHPYFRQKLFATY